MERQRHRAGRTGADAASSGSRTGRATCSSSGRAGRTSGAGPINQSFKVSSTFVDAPSLPHAGRQPRPSAPAVVTSARTRRRPTVGERTRHLRASRVVPARVLRRHRTPT